MDKIKEVEIDIVNLIEDDFPEMVKTIRSNEKLSQDQIDKFLNKATETVSKYKTI